MSSYFKMNLKHKEVKIRRIPNCLKYSATENQSNYKRFFKGKTSNIIIWHN